MKNEKIKPDVFIDVSDDKMQTKNYQPLLSIIGWQCPGYIKDKTNRYIKKETFLDALKQTLKGTSVYLRKQYIKVYKELGLLHEDGEYYYFVPIDTKNNKFTTLKPQTIRFCLEYMDEFTFKMYCWLSYYFERWHANPAPHDYFRFSISTMMRGLGYKSTRDTNYAKANLSLNILSNLGLISFSDSEYNENHKGMWMILWEVNQYSKPQKETAKKVVEHKMYDIKDSAVKEIIDLPLTEVISKQINSTKEKEVKQIKEKDETSKEKKCLHDNPLKWYDQVAGRSPHSGINSSTRGLLGLLYYAIKDYLTEGKIATFEVTDQLRQISIEVFGYDYCDELVGKA